MGKNWWQKLFPGRGKTTVVELGDEIPPGETGPEPPPSGGPSAGAFSFLQAAADAAPQAATEPAPVMDTLPNPVVTTGRLRSLGLAPVYVPSLREQAILHRVVAQDTAESAPADALQRWQAVLALCPGDVEALAGSAAAQEVLYGVEQAEETWAAVLALDAAHAGALAAVARLEALRGSRPASVEQEGPWS